ncbi:DUF3179 domain-containing protein [Actinotalea sp.]|uniref:DUF3179 domain-containing protein n=1 Tax=Actinotalea sp. TaxID=1872145 RepID=UPI003569BDD2
MDDPVLGSRPAPLATATPTPPTSVVHRRRGPIAALAVTALLLAGCAGRAQGPAPASPSGSALSGSAVVLEPMVSGPREDVPSALDDPADPALPTPAVDPARILAGGPPPDGIPAIDEPRFLPAAGVDWLGADEAVIALDLDGHQRAYPVQILHWHEIVNDTVGGRPVAVTYCPLCNTALAFDRQAAGRVLDFGTSGSLYLSALVMYDRQTQSLWSQVERSAIAGTLTGTELELIPVTMLRWADWLAAAPEGWVLSRETGAQRPYGTNPYVGYDDIDNTDTFLDEAVDTQFAAKLRVVVFPGAADPVAVLAGDLAALGVAEILVDGSPVILFSAPGLASALDVADVADGAPVTATGAFRPEVDGRVLTFTTLIGGEPGVGPAAGAAVARDEQTGSDWDLLGRAVDGPLAGARLTAVPHVNTFWFAQAAFRPDTEVLRLQP